MFDGSGASARWNVTCVRAKIHQIQKNSYLLNALFVAPHDRHGHEYYHHIKASFYTSNLLLKIIFIIWRAPQL
jgi:hypothetical protein